MKSKAESGCACFSNPGADLIEERALGMDSRYAEVSVLVCRVCGQRWLRYHHELEAFSRSGQWYLGPISKERAARVVAEEAKDFLESLPWYFYGGSYFDGRSGRTSGKIFV